MKFKVLVIVLILGFVGFWGVLETLDENYAASYADTVYIDVTPLTEDGAVLQVADPASADPENPTMIDSEPSSLTMQLGANDTANDATFTAKGIIPSEMETSLMGTVVGAEFNIGVDKTSTAYTTSKIASYDVEVTKIAKCTDIGSDACYPTAVVEDTTAQ